MDNQRLLIWAFFAMMLWLTWQTWQQESRPRPEAPPAGQATTQTQADAVPAVPVGEDDVPERADGNGERRLSRRRPEPGIDVRRHNPREAICRP